jgi:hypothetical protein
VVAAIDRRVKAVVSQVPVVDKDPLAPSALPTPDSWEWFTHTAETQAPLLVAEGDHLVPSELAIAGFDLAHQPKGAHQVCRRHHGRSRSPITAAGLRNMT